MTINQTDMQPMFTPQSVAVVGASDNPAKLGFHVMKSLTLGGFEGTLIPVNLNADQIMGCEAFPSLTAFKGHIDLAIVVVPAKRVAEVFSACIEKNVKGIVLITAGFKEIDDPAGTSLHSDIAGMINRAEIPVIGPNTFGMVNLHANLNASFTPEFSMLPKGRIALVSQSGGLAHLLGFMAMRAQIGFSKIIGLGNRLNMDFAEMINFLMNDDETDVIMLYMEGIDQPIRFVEALKRHGNKKPVIIYKTGSSQKSDLASQSHTGSMAGKHAIYQGAFRQAGILTTDSAETLLDTAKALAVSPIPQGPGVAILSGQAGPGIAACDVCDACGLNIVNFNKDTQERINAYLPPLALRTNPVDMGPAWYDAKVQSGIVEAVMNDCHVDAVLLLIMFASANADLLGGLYDQFIKFKPGKPIISCIAAPPEIWDKQIHLLESAGVLVNYPTPERAALVLANLVKYRGIQFKARQNVKRKAVPLTWLVQNDAEQLSTLHQYSGL